MKQCPVCKNTYADDSLSFCLADGAALFSNSITSEPTQQFSVGTNPIRVEIPQNTSPTINAQPASVIAQTSSPKKEGRAINMLIGLSIGFALTALLAVIAVGGWMMFRSTGKNELATNDKPIVIEKNTPAVSPTPDETANLKTKIDNLEKKIQDQKKPNIPTIPGSPVSSPQTAKNTARVNSPGDGFLALRTMPSSETGDRILQIPHGATVTVLGCQAKAAGKKARWCRVDYNGNLGWAYDGFLVY